jgi:hypothetical protein
MYAAQVTTYYFVPCKTRGPEGGGGEKIKVRNFVITTAALNTQLTPNTTFEIDAIDGAEGEQPVQTAVTV